MIIAFILGILVGVLIFSLLAKQAIGSYRLDKIMMY